jgi:hypothetical protein
MKWPHALWLLCFSLPAFCETDIPQQAGAPQISFNDLQYRLGYDVYLANKNLAAAWQVAYKAISAEPNNVFWLQRFAQVSEWVGKPVEALEAWFKYAQATNDNSAWDNVGRLAEALYNDTLLLAYQKRLVSLHPNDEAAILKLVQVYERLGQPNEGLDFLAQLVSKSKAKRTLLVAEANLAERAGQDERAVATFSRLIDSFPPVETTWLLRRAALWFQRGKLMEAWQSLNDIENKIAPRDADYWHTYAELSRLLNKKEAAERAYQHLTDEFVFGDGDLTNYSALQNDTDPLNAAFVSELSYRLYNRDNAVLSLLYLYQKANHPQGIKRFLGLLSAQELAKFEQNPLFLEQRGQFYWQQKQLQLAQRDYEHALALAPQQSRLLQALVGILTEQNNTLPLTQLLLAADGAAKRNSALWQTWALAWLHLQQPLRALPFQQAYARTRPQDSLAQLTLADILAATGNEESATSIRKAIWQQRAILTQNETGERLQQLQDNLFSLQLNQQSAEQSQHSLQQWLTQHPQPYRAFEHELSLGWLLNHEYFDGARQWISQQNNKDIEMPTWATLRLALQNQDSDSINQLLNQKVEQLPIYDRIEAATGVNRPDLAESLAFNTQESYPQDDELHRRYSDLLSERGHSIALDITHNELGALGIQQQQIAWATPISPLWRFNAQLQQQQYEALDNITLNNSLADRQFIDLEWQRQSSQQTWQFALTQGSGWSNFTGWRIKQQYRVDSQITASWQWLQNQPTNDSTGLILAGTKNRWAAGVNWAMTGREYLNAELNLDDYLSQDGVALGTGQLLQVDAGHRLFADQSDHVLKLSMALSKFNANNPLDPRFNRLTTQGQTLTTGFFIPQDYQQIGLAWAFGQVNQAQHQRGLRLMGEFGINSSNVSGTGFNGRLGLQSPVLGNDRLRLELSHSQSGQQNGDSSQEIRLNYRLFY